MDDTRILWKKTIDSLGRTSGQRLSGRRLSRRLEQLRLLQDEGQRRLQNLRKLYHELSLSEQKYFSLFEHDPHPRLLLSQDARILEVNQAAIALLGVERAVLLETKLDAHMELQDVTLWQNWLAKTFQDETLQLFALRRTATTHTLRVILKAVREQSSGLFFLLVTLEKIAPHPLIPPQIDAGQDYHAPLVRRRIFSLLDALPAFVYLQDRQRTIQYANTAFRTIFGEIEGGRTCLQVFHPLGHRCDVCHSDRLFKEGGTEQWEITDSQGRVYMVHDSLFLEEGWEPLMMGVGLEITQRIRAEEALLRSEHRFQALARMAPVGIFRTDAWGDWIFVNPRWEEITGYSAQQAMATGWQEAIFQEDRQQLLLQWQNSLAEPFPFQAEFRLQKATGQVVWVICQATPDVDETDGFVGMVGTITDISERRIMEEALSQSNRRYRAIVEDQTELISRFQPDGSLTFVNEAYCRYFNRLRDALLGSHFLHHVMEETKETILPKLAALTRSSPVVVIEHQSIVGDMRWQKWTYRAIFAPEGGLAEYQAVGRDITEEKKIQEAILHLKDELELQERKRLAITLHDGVGQSMQAINLGLKLAATTFPHDPAEALKTLREMSREVTETIAQLRDITGELRPSFLERMELVEAMRWWGGRVAERSRVEVRILPRTELPPLGLRIKYNCFQIFQEALTNAIKHSGSKDVTITLERTQDDHVKMEITDRGKGFDPHREGGASQGLGLSIIPERVARMGGTLQVRSEPGRGVTITVLVPCLEKDCTGG